MDISNNLTLVTTLSSQDC